MTDAIVHRAGPVDARRARSVRLRALAESPDAFWTTLAEDRAQPIDAWRERLLDPDATTSLAVRAGADIGLAVGRPTTTSG